MSDDLKNNLNKKGISKYWWTIVHFVQGLSRAIEIQYERIWKKPWLRKTVTVVFITVFSIGLLNFFFWSAPANFPNPAVVDIPDGADLSTVAIILKQDRIIQSPFWFVNSIIYLKGERKIVGGEYYFEQPLSVWSVAERLVTGNFHIGQFKTTIPEGSTIAQISQILSAHYPLFNSVGFLTLAAGQEGYLFPDTYYFGADPKPETVIDLMRSNFNQKILNPTTSAAIVAFGKPLSDVITMASILEAEARQDETRRTVAGILWHRIVLKIPLGVDSTLHYINGKTSAELTTTDLKTDSPYNTYVHKGLPPTPINNPGLSAIMDAVTPIQTSYLFFLTGNDNVMYYATTLQQQDANKAKYIGD